MLGGLNDKIVGGKKILSKTINLRTVESEIADSLEKVQNKFKNVDIGSYPFFKKGKIGVSIVIRSTEKSLASDCYKDIKSFINKKKIKTIER
jgi:molybdopterin-biosynthesis enzyme MoeA-like protein